MLLLVAGLVAALLRRNAADRLLLWLCGGALLLIALMLGHVNDYYLVFLYPFFCLWFGAWLANFFRDDARPPAGMVRLSTAALFVLLATLCLYAIFGHARAQETNLRRNQAEILRLEAIGREIDAMLPAEDIVVAGDPGYYLGMPQRLNYGVNFSFTWRQPEYWAFAEPQAIIVTLGVDDSYSDLDSWLLEHEFRPGALLCPAGERRWRNHPLPLAGARTTGARDKLRAGCSGLAGRPVMPKSPAFWQQIPARIRHSPTGSLLWLCAAAGLGADAADGAPQQHGAGSARSAGPCAMPGCWR